MKGQTIITLVKNASRELGGKFYTSKRGVPLIIITLPNGSLGNLCYFRRTRVWRWFYPAWVFDVDVVSTDFESLSSFKRFMEAPCSNGHETLL